jgi:hypothetical protein
MQLRIIAATLVGLSLTAPPHLAAANHAAEVISYESGTGAAAGYNLTASILGEPSRVTPGEFGGPVDPFSAPWQPGQLLSLGAGGSVTLRFDEPVFDLSANPFGLDFIIFGAAAFLIVNGDFSGGGITDGSLFGNNTGLTEVWVSADGLSFHRLNPALAPVVDGLFPTDGVGDFTQPVNPALSGADFAGLGLSGIRAFYDGSAGGTGFDIGWAQDASGAPAGLDRIEFVRIDVLSERAEIDALSAVPEPSAARLLLLAVVLMVFMRPKPVRRGDLVVAGGLCAGILGLPLSQARTAHVREDFTTDPAGDGWRVHGEESLFRWDSTRERLEVTWDSTRTNSFFYQPLGTVLTRNDDFRVSFTLELDEVRTASPETTFQLAVGLISRHDALETGFFRGAGVHPTLGPRNVVEFNYFPASQSIAPTHSLAAVATNNTRWATIHLFPVEFIAGDRIRVEFSMEGTEQELLLSVTRNDTEPILGRTALSAGFGDFRVDTFSITSYSGLHQPEGYAGGILARGWMDDIEIAFPDGPLAALELTVADGETHVDLPIIEGWRPRLQRSLDLRAWEFQAAEPAIHGTRWRFTDADPPAFSASYRVILERL